jgi:hypothetical protein
MQAANEDGVLIACSKAIEWMLPWWWMHYHFYNSLPVSFVDFGMSEEAKRWCQNRGQLISLSLSNEFVAKQEDIEPKLAELWVIFQGKDIWRARKEWFKKPFAMLQTPYRRTIWLDLDCQVRKCLGDLFNACHNPAGLAIVRDPFQYPEGLDGFVNPGEVIYNSGVIVYMHDSPIIQEWAEKTLEYTKHFLGDQNILSRVIFLKKLMFCELPLYYNWFLKLGSHVPAAIRHFTGPEGKNLILTEISAVSNLSFVNLAVL